MPIFKVNNFGQIGVSLSSLSNTVKVKNKPTVKMSKKLSLGALSETTFTIIPPQIELEKSSSKWSLFLKSISLFENFEGFIANVFGLIKPKNEIYFTSIAWDYSGNSPFIYPPNGSKGENFLIPMESDTKRIFIGDGVNLFPAQQVVGALNIIILVFECDQDVRELGERLTYLHDQVNNSKLTSLIKAISVTPSLATGIAIGEAVNELMFVIGNIMKSNCDDYVDMFEGSYGTEKEHESKIETNNNSACGIELEFFVS